MSNKSIKFLENFDINRFDSPEFKEDSVREIIILPILRGLGYDDINIERSKNLKHPFLKIGSKKRAVNIVPDYLLKVSGNYAWVLDAKAPNGEIKYGQNVEQVYSYAIHPEVRARYFALCNGKEFVLFRYDSDEKPLLYFELPEIAQYWNKLEFYLSPDSFQSGKTISYKDTFPASFSVKEEFDYLSRMLLDEIPVKKQQAKRHFGVHGYFTKQAWNIVQDYIRNFTNVGDVVLDPFGGSGVTAIEALMTDRKGIHIDLNPLSVFIVQSLVAPVKTAELTTSFDKVVKEFVKLSPKNKYEIKKALKKYPYPQGHVLPKGSDVNTVDKLFSDDQLANMALLKRIIMQEKNADIRNTLLLMFSGLLTKVNLTYHTTPNKPRAGQGDASAFRYYRYRIAPFPVDVDIVKYFELRFKKVLAAKREIAQKISEDTINNIQVYKGTATDLNKIKNQSIDYIYTDPPYGAKIPYLDLSVMWNAWLDLEVTDKDHDLEAIEGGTKDKTKENYGDLISQSIQEMYRVLKYDRWMSFVFAHKDPEFWHLIVETAEKSGFEYAGAVKQANGQTSFKKRQNPFTVLSGQLIINFKKVHKPKAIMKANLGMDISEIVFQTIEGIIAKHNGATLEQINDELIIKGLELGFLDLLKKEYSDLTPLLISEFDFNRDTHLFTIRPNAKFKTNIDIKLRIKYYLFSFLRRQQLEKKQPTFDEIVLNIMPLLKNGITPENQTILNVLEDIGERIGHDRWQLKDSSFQLSLNL